jgi:drug/metabolite transporter (DMT)-like permease
MGILLGLLTALSWGSSDFLARFASRRIGSLRTTLYMQLTGLVLLTIVLRWIGGWGHLFDGSGWRPWAWGALAGALNAISTLSLYRSFEVGKLSVVAPLSASYPALTVAISAFTGEHLTATRAAGIVLILVGVIVVVRGEAESESVAPTSQPTSKKKPASGIGAAMMSAVGLGVLDTGAFVLNNLGMQLEQVSVVSVLASLYGAVTVLLSTLVLREKMSRWQWLGIVAIFAGIALVSR